MVSDIAVGKMYDPLSAADDQGQLSKKGLVTGWQTHDAGDVVTLTIRSGVKFHNGEPLTAADGKFSFETWKEQTGGSPSLTGAAMRGILKRVDVRRPGFQYEICWEEIVRHRRRDEQTEHVFETREQMVGCQHERGTDFRPSEIGKWVAD